MPLLYLEEQVTAAFGGMRWDDLQHAHAGIQMVDERVESDAFWAHFNALTNAHNGATSG